MKSIMRMVAGICVGGSAILALGSSALAQEPADGTAASTASARAGWEQRVVQNGRPASGARSLPPLTDYRRSSPQFDQPRQQTSATTPDRTAMRTEVAASGSPEVVPPGQVQSGPISANDPPATNAGPVFDGPAYSGPAYSGPAYSGPAYSGPAPGPGCAACGRYPDQGEFGGYGGGQWGECGECGNECDGCWNGCYGHRGLLDGGLFRNLQLFAGADGFKGPVDQGTNGNFGLHEGLNFGAPLGDPWGLGYQIGFSAAQSNFSGGQVLTQLPGEVTLRSAARHQYFLTTGIFQRALCCGVQWGVVFDLQHDAYYDTNNHAADLKQIRSETSYLFPGGINEIGYFGAYSVGTDEFNLNNIKIGLRSTDMFAVFYRRHFESGGEGRVWAGVSGHGDALVGGDFSVPLGQSWALESRINYLIPKQGNGVGGQFEEAWGLSMQLVWYPGRRAACALNSCYRPLLGVADNATFMVNASSSTPAQ